MTSAAQARSRGADFEKSPCYTTENLAPSLWPVIISQHMWNLTTRFGIGVLPGMLAPSPHFPSFFPPMDFHLTDRQESRGGGCRGGEKGKRTFLILLLYGAAEIPQAKHNTDWKRSGKRLSGAWQEESAVGGQVKAALEDKQFMCYQHSRENSSSLHWKEIKKQQ